MTETATGGQGTEQPLTIEGVGRVTDKFWEGRGRFLDLLDMPGADAPNPYIGVMFYGRNHEHVATVMRAVAMDDRAYRTAVRKVALVIEPRPAYIVFEPGRRTETTGNREDLPGGLYESPATDEEFLADGTLRDDWRDERERDRLAHIAKWKAYAEREGMKYVPPYELPGCDR